MPKRPNILFIISDQMVADLTGAYGHPVVRGVGGDVAHSWKLVDSMNFLQRSGRHHDVAPGVV